MEEEPGRPEAAGMGGRGDLPLGWGAARQRLGSVLACTTVVAYEEEPDFGPHPF